jgi:hypothetical protein
MAHDSLVTVRLSEPPSLTVDTNLRPDVIYGRSSRVGESHSRDSGRNEKEDDAASDNSAKTKVAPGDTEDTLSHEAEEPDGGVADGSQESETGASSDSEEVNWAELEKTEDEEPKDRESDTVSPSRLPSNIAIREANAAQSTALLLARLEQENAKLATNPKSAKAKVIEQGERQRSRPPSMAQLRQMVNGPTPPALRYSMLPPPPMTDLEFYAALVKDYQQTAARLPTLLSNKIRKGIPPPLRGVVWQSMSGARDPALEEQYERLSGESSPYEPIIGKDLGRSFPGVDMFRDADGDGQRMLGRVLKCFSLHNQKIGYCQGLAFLVGPLLMHMPDQQAFCVLVR